MEYVSRFLYDNLFCDKLFISFSVLISFLIIPFIHIIEIISIKNYSYFNLMKSISLYIVLRKFYNSSVFLGIIVNTLIIYNYENSIKIN